MLRQNRKIQFIILLTLVCLVGTMSIAYAILSTSLNINGTAEVMDASWNVHFENINVNSGSVPINPTITDNDKITFSADLTTPGEFYKFTVDIVNSGSIDAMIESIIKNPELTADQKKYLRYEVEYIDGTSINETQLLKSGETKTISVLVSYRNDITTTDLPQTETDLDLEIRLVYVQSTSLATEIPSNEKPLKIVNGNISTIGSEICIDKECFYLIGTRGTNAIFLSKYNLYVGNTYDQTNGEAAIKNPTGIQNELAKAWIDGYSVDNPIIGMKPFALSYYWANNPQNYPTYVYNENSNYYNDIENYKSYLEQYNIPISSARLITLEELVALGCDKDNYTCINAPSWVYTTTYVSGTANTNTSMWTVNSNASFDDEFIYHDYGVRPVIEIPLTEF